MLNFFKRFFGTEKKINHEANNLIPGVKVYVDGNEIKNTYSTRILRKPNLIEHIKLPSFGKEFDRIIKIQDHLDLRRKYSVNLYKMECSCPSFLEKNKNCSREDLNRVCQHLKDAIDQNLAKEKPFLTKVIIRFYNKSDDLFYYAYFDEMFIIHFRESYYWVNIIAENNLEIKYAYNFVEKRWSSAGIPEKSEDLINEISSIVVPG